MGKRVLAAGIAALVILVGCSPSVPLPHPGQLLYISTFDAFNEDWQLYEGKLAAQIVNVEQNPALQITVDDVQEGAFTVMEQLFSDFDLIVDVTEVAGPVDLDAPGFGVLFRHQDNRNYYVFLISGDGYYQVARRLNGVDEVLSDWAPTPAIRQGHTTNTLRVIGQGEVFTFYINDIQVPLCLTIWNPLVPGECQLPRDSEEVPVQWSAEAVVMALADDAIAQGHIGLGARSFEQSGIAVSFDNLLVCGPQDVPPVPFHCEELAPAQP